MAKHVTLSLSQQNAIRLAVVFVAFEILVALAVVFMLMLPMARRAANDLAGLMVLSVQTWSELPPETRPAFANELRTGHGLVLATRPPAGPAAAATRGPYLRQLDAELSRRAGAPVDLLSLEQNGATWHWAALPSGNRTLWIGFSHARFGPQPLAAGALTLLAGFFLAGLAAWWLARRTVAPLERFGSAAAALGRGETPDLLPETGPRELATLARRFNELSTQIHDLLEARTTLLVGVSHDLRTPLARMRLALEMIERRPDPAWIARLDADIGEMNQLVGDLLELARGLGREEPRALALPNWLEEWLEPLRPGQAAIEIDCPTLALHAAPAALRRALGNLVSNAQRYAPGSPIRLRVVAAPDSVLFGVLDRGPGIPSEQLETVFRPFQRVDASRSPNTGGAGLGLAIVRQLALANGWRAWLENRPDGGLAAWLQLPRIG